MERPLLHDPELVDRLTSTVSRVITSVLGDVGVTQPPTRIVDQLDVLVGEVARLRHVPDLEQRTDTLKTALDRLENLVDEPHAKRLPVSCLTCGHITTLPVRDYVTRCVECGHHYSVLEGKYAAQQRANALAAGLRLVRKVRVR